MCPLILFALILVFLSAFTYESTRVQSNLSAFALAYVLRQCTTQPHHSAWFVRIFALVLALLASALILRNEEWVRAQDVTAAPINLLDDEEEDEDIVYCRQQGATQLIMPHPPTTCA
jgi:putative copper export protein